MRERAAQLADSRISKHAYADAAHMQTRRRGATKRNTVHLARPTGRYPPLGANCRRAAACLRPRSWAAQMWTSLNKTPRRGIGAYDLTRGVCKRGPTTIKYSLRPFNCSARRKYAGSIHREQTALSDQAQASFSDPGSPATLSSWQPEARSEALTLTEDRT